MLPSNNRTPDGEIVVSSRHPTFIAYCVDAAKARRLRREGIPRVSVRELAQTRGLVSIAWTGLPASELQTTVEGCVFG